MRHIFSEVIRFLASVFEHWQIWLSGGGLGGAIVLSASLIERISGRGLSKKSYVYLFLVTFFLCSCFLSWVDKDDALKLMIQASTEQTKHYETDLQTARNLYTQLQASCAYQRGVMDALGNQNRDQQNSINKCQDRALSMMAPVPFQINQVLVNPGIEADGSFDPKKRHAATFILFANKTVEDVKIIVKCDRSLIGGRAYPLRFGSLVNQPIGSLLPNGSLLIGYDSPPWTATNPVQVQVTYTGDPAMTCEFTKQ